MARETKVGLLVGLVFIVCFAVILANRGRQDALQTQLPFAFMMDHEVPVPVAPSGTAAPGSGYATRGTYSPTPAPEYVGQPDPAASYEQVADTRGSFTHQLPVVTRPQAQPQAPAVSPAAPRTEGLRTDLPPREQALQELLDQRYAQMQGGVAGTESPAAETSGTSLRGTPLTAVESPSSARSAPSRVEEPSPVRTEAALHPSARRHKVVPKDTLSKIALTYYGSRSPRVVDALFEANRNVLPQKDMVPLGVELVLPEIAGMTPVAQHARGPAEAPARTRLAAQPAAEEPASTFRWYQIKKNDRYISIAREQLGDESRWREIHELNKDKFPDPGKIRAGVRIKLPAAGAGERTTTS